MRNVTRFAAVVVLFVFVATPWYLVFRGDVDAADVPSEWSMSAVFSWDKVTTNTDGTPIGVDLAGYKVAIFEDVLPLGTPIASATTVGVVEEMAARPLFTGLVSGKSVRAAVLAFDLAGNTSAWSESISGKLNLIAPGKPSGFGCRNVSP